MSITVSVQVTDSLGATAAAVATADIGSPTSIIPANRMTTWNPGLNAVGGIPNRTTIFKTLAPSGGDDTSAINAAIAACPPNQVVQLTVGVFKISGGGVFLLNSNVTLRGAGPGDGIKNIGVNPVGGSSSNFVVDPTATQLIKTDRNSDFSDSVVSVGPSNISVFNQSINLTADAIKGTNQCTIASIPTGLAVGSFVLVDMNTSGTKPNQPYPTVPANPDVFWGGNADPPGQGSRYWFHRLDRSIAQVMEVTAINGTTIIFATPFHYTMSVIYVAQLSTWQHTPTVWSGIEDLFVMGGNAGGAPCGLCAYCWLKHIEVTWTWGGGVTLDACYRCTIRDSFIHEQRNPTPGGSGYLSMMTYGTSDCLFENNIMWYGNKVITMQSAGGGNVVAYNYMDDAFGATYPQSPEAGVNAGHNTTTLYTLIEGNYSHNFKGDSYWGGSIYNTIFRNHLSAIRAAHPPLKTFVEPPGYPYGDYAGRSACDVQKGSYYHNFVGNVLGKQGQVLLSFSNSTFSNTQTVFVYEDITYFPKDNEVYMWSFGAFQTSSTWMFDPMTINTQLRNGNWDWVTQKQIWYANIGDHGTVSTGTPQLIPDSLYLTSKPTFFGANQWPWVDPSTGVTLILPAKHRFDAGTPNLL